MNFRFHRFLNGQCGGYPFLDTFFLRSDWTRPNQNKTRLAGRDWDQPNCDKNILRCGHVEVQNINIKSVCRQHSVIHLTYNITNDISSLFSHSKICLADSFQHFFLRMNRGSDNSKCENFWLDEGFVDKRGSPFTILF